MPATKANDINANDQFFKLDKAAAAWHFAEITQPHSKAEYAKMWNQERKRYNLHEYSDTTQGGYNRTDFLPARYETNRKYKEPKISLDQDCDDAQGWDWRNTLMSGNTTYEIQKFDDVFSPQQKTDLMLSSVSNNTVKGSLQVSARWYPQWTVNWNQSANVAFFLLSALFELSKKGPSFLKYAHMLILEADFSRTQDDAASCNSSEFITKLGGLEAIEQQRKDLQVEKVADYKLPTTFKWTFETGLDIDDPQEMPYVDGGADGQADLLTQNAFGALALAYDGAGVGANKIDRFAKTTDGSTAKYQTNANGIITGHEYISTPYQGVDEDDWNDFIKKQKTRSGKNFREEQQFLGFRWADLIEAEERKRGCGNPHKFDKDGNDKAAPGRLACNKALKTTFELLREEPEFDNMNYYRLFGAWIDTESQADGSVYPKMTEWLFEPVQNCFGYDDEPNKHGFALLYLEARVRSKRGAAAVKKVAQEAKGSGAGKAWAGWIVDFLWEESIQVVQEDLPTHLEPELHDGKVVFSQKFGKKGPNPIVNKETNLNQPQEGHWMRCGRLTTQDDAAAKAGEGRDYWINGFSAAEGTVSGWILGDNGVHHEVWFSSARSDEEESSRALYAGRPPYQTMNSLPKGSIIEDEDLLRDDVPWTGPNFEGEGYGDYSDYDSYGYDGYDNYDYSGYSGYSNGYSY